MSLIIKEHKSSSYAPRTYYNATSADMTLAIALDFNTAGEKLTKKAATTKLYYPIQLHRDIDTLVEARKLYSFMKKHNVKTVNVAGNGIYTLQKFCNQEYANCILYEILKPIQEHLGIHKIFNGGQTGFDLAGTVVAVVLDVECESTLPKGFKMRFEDGKDILMDVDEIYKLVDLYRSVL